VRESLRYVAATLLSSGKQHKLRYVLFEKDLRLLLFGKWLN
jgi:hypothetical protein